MSIQSPYIISASRSTDIPAFYMDWFINRLKAGYSVWTNPFNNQRTTISYENCRFIVFWSKNPKSLLDYQQFFKERDIHLYIQYTLNDYVDDNLELNVPSVEERVETFKKLIDMYGQYSVVWRFDPLILTDTITQDVLITKIQRIGNLLRGYTDKLVFSFCDIEHYPKVKRNLINYNVPYREWTKEDMFEFANKLSSLNISENWNYTLATCAEAANLSEFGIIKNKCVDDELITKIAYTDSILMKHLGIEIHNIQNNILGEPDVSDNAILLIDNKYALRTKSNRDSGQRLLCGCISSKDIGEYNTCIHQCKYCYANSSNALAYQNYKSHLLNPNSETITGN